MTTEVLNKEIVNYIISDIELTLQRLGINVQLSIEQCEDYKHEKFDKLISTSFQTVPMLFKEIHIEGDINVMTKATEEDYCKVIINLGVSYAYFDGGTNGHEPGRHTHLQLPIKQRRGGNESNPRMESARQTFHSRALQ